MPTDESYDWAHNPANVIQFESKFITLFGEALALNGGRGRKAIESALANSNCGRRDDALMFLFCILLDGSAACVDWSGWRTCLQFREADYPGMTVDEHRDNVYQSTPHQELMKWVKKESQRAKEAYISPWRQA